MRKEGAQPEVYGGYDDAKGNSIRVSLDLYSQLPQVLITVTVDGLSLRNAFSVLHTSLP